jgi:biopolymer transport protein ExbD
MTKHTMPDVKEGGVNVTPLIDVVMVLIVFFMLVAKVGVTTGAIKMELPETILGKKMEELKGTLFLNVLDPRIERDPNGLPLRDAAGRVKRIQMAGLYEPLVTGLVDQDDREPKEIKLYKKGPAGENVDYPLRRLLDAAHKRDPNFSVTIRAEKDLEYGMMQHVLVECANAGIKNINYGTNTKKE